MDVVVVGGGLVGCAVALRLAKAGAQVTVVERSVPGAEASSAAAGILAPQAESEGPGTFLSLCLRSRALYPSFVEEVEALSGIRVGFRPLGVLHAAFSQGSLERLRGRVALQASLGLSAELLEPSAALRLEPGLNPALHGAAHFPGDASVDNRLLMRALSMAAARSGVRFVSGHVRALLEHAGRAGGVDVDGAPLVSDAVVVAAGAWTGLVPGCGLSPRQVRPARGQMVMLRARLPLLERVVFSDQGYLVPRADGHLLAGSTLEFEGFAKEVTAAGLKHILALALELAPGLAPLPVVEMWAGLRPFTEDRLPVLGPGPLPGLFLASGHFRNGILLAPVTAELLTQAVFERTPSLPLEPFRWDRPGIT
ncbi:MAG: glycine oxidase ThiO [Myxococcaceae bacterium]